MGFRVRICFAAKLKELKDIRKAKEEEKYRQELEQRLKRENAVREERERKEREKKELEEARERDRLERVKKYNEQKALVKKEREELKQQAVGDKMTETDTTSKLAGVTRNEEGDTYRKTSLVAECSVLHGLNGSEIELKDPLGLVKMNNVTEDEKEQSMNSGICSDKGNFAKSIFGSNEEILYSLTKGDGNAKTEQYGSKEEYGQKLEDDLKVSKIFVENQSFENTEVIKSQTVNDEEIHERISLYRKEDKNMGIHESESADLRMNISEKIHERESVINKEDDNKETSERESGDLGENRFVCNKPEKEATEIEVTENENIKSEKVGQTENSLQVVGEGEDCDTPKSDDNTDIKVCDQCTDNVNGGTNSLNHADDVRHVNNNCTYVGTVADNDIPDVSNGVIDDTLLEFLCELYEEWKKTVAQKR